MRLDRPKQPRLSSVRGASGPLDTDPLDEVISLAEAAELSGLAAHTLTQQAKKRRLHARKVGHTWLTTRRWLEVYVQSRARHASYD